MRIPLFYIPKTKFKKFLHIERRYKYKDLIIPIGCDCHPANSLNKLHLRTASYPFDWLNIDPLYTFPYVNENIATEFKDFVQHIEKNENGYFIAQKYPMAEFMHEKYLDQEASKQKLMKRSKRFLGELKSKKIAFLHNIPAHALKSEDSITSFLTDIKKFISLIKPGDKLHIYIRCDNSLDENSALTSALKKEIEALGINVTIYCRKLNRFGIWGDPKDYLNLYQQLGLKLTEIFPKIYFR